MEDEEAGQIPMAYVVRAAGAELTEAQVMEYVARQVRIDIIYIHIYSPFLNYINDSY